MKRDTKIETEDKILQLLSDLSDEEKRTALGFAYSNLRKKILGIKK